MSEHEGIYLTSSEMSTWLRCQRKWWLRIYRGLDNPEHNVEPVNVGNMFHAALDVFYSVPEDLRRESVTAAKQAIMDIRALYREESPDYISLIDGCAETAGIMLEGYVEWLEEEGHDEPLDIYSTEENVEVPLEGTPYIARGKLDIRAKSKITGKRRPMDTKTVKDFKRIPPTAHMNLQFKTYYALEYLKGLEEGSASDVESFTVNMARRVKRGSDAKPPYYKRINVIHNKDEILHHIRHMVAIGNQIENARSALDSGVEHHDIVPPSQRQDCAHDCEFFRVCPMFDDGSNAELYLSRQFKVGDPNERYKKGDVTKKGSVDGEA